MEKLLCIIPARGGSKRIPHKNIREFKGKPIIAYAISAAIESGIATEVMVSTDDDEIATIANQFGANTPFMRSKENSNDTSGIADVLIEVIESYKALGREFEYILCVLATSPLIQSSNLKKAYDMLQTNKVADSVCPIEKFSYPPQRSLIIRNGELVMKHPENYNSRSQDLEPLYHDCGQFFLFRTKALLRDKMLYTKHTLPLELKESESQDIDNMEDWKLAEMKYELIKEKKQ